MCTMRPVNFGPELHGSHAARPDHGRHRDAARRSRARSGSRGYIRRQRITSSTPATARATPSSACCSAGSPERPCIVHVHVAYGPGWAGCCAGRCGTPTRSSPISEFVGRSLVDAWPRAETGPRRAQRHRRRRWNPGPDRDADPRASSASTDDDPVVLTVCRLFPEKGPAELIEAVADRPRRVPGRPAARSSAATVTPSQWFAAHARRRWSAERDLGGHVRFLGWRDDVAAADGGRRRLRHAVDGEPFGLVFAEAMAMELPVVALDDGGTPEVVEDGRSGLLSDHGDVDALAANLVTLLRRSRAPPARWASTVAGGSRRASRPSAWRPRSPSVYSRIAS